MGGGGGGRGGKGTTSTPQNPSESAPVVFNCLSELGTRFHAKASPRLEFGITSKRIRKLSYYLLVSDMQTTFFFFFFFCRLSIFAV